MEMTREALELVEDGARRCAENAKTWREEAENLRAWVAKIEPDLAAARARIPRAEADAEVQERQAMGLRAMADAARRELGMPPGADRPAVAPPAKPGGGGAEALGQSPIEASARAAVQGERTNPDPFGSARTDGERTATLKALIGRDIAFTFFSDTEVFTGRVVAVEGGNVHVTTALGTSLLPIEDIKGTEAAEVDPDADQWSRVVAVGAQATRPAALPNGTEPVDAAVTRHDGQADGHE